MVDHQNTITTDYFKVPVSAMVRHLLGRWLKIWGIALAAVLSSS